MNNIDTCLERLLRAAARAPRVFPGVLPCSLENRVLVAWRTPAPTDYSAELIPLFRRALLCACALILLSLALTLRASLEETPPNELAILDSVIQVTLAP